MDDTYLQEAKRFKPRRHLPPRKFTVDQAGIDQLLASCKTPLERLLVTLLSHTGLRVSEAASLKLTDIEVEKRVLTVRRAKWGKTRRVGLTAPVLEAFQAYLAVRPPVQSDFIFINRKRKPMDR